MFNTYLSQAIAVAQQQLKQNPNQYNNPNVANWINVIENGNQSQGEAIANNIINSLGLTKEQAIQQAESGLRQRGIIR